ncbi:helix-turn-helix domain-containing protein [Streptomyces sp. NRRL B-1347]|uniref:helix-turn-helix domain-containing protein n=1 Tax=Streptomyces sp. NRRL B-1347 TaxID=1476877 RepID=UPI0004C6176F|nr:helix-turn-helix transcriptional regulator [Streptomyces sp. NRRL B-1347]
MPNDTAVRFGELVSRLAAKAGYDMERRGTGRVRLAEATGMSASAIGRMVRGETLPEPASYQRIAAAVGVPTRQLLVEAGILPSEGEHTCTNPPVRSVTNPPTPEAVADLLGVTAPMVRAMLIASIEQALRLQNETGGTNGGDAVARG